jgi:hypothetical protein
MLAEIARGGWGLVECKTHVAAKAAAVGSKSPYVLQRDFEWDSMVKLAAFAAKSEYTQYR